MLFSGEEGYGRYVDLYAHHTTYNNLKGLNKRLAYLQYLDVLSAAEHGLVHQEVPNETRYSRDYELYVLKSYVIGPDLNHHPDIYRIYTHTFYRL